MRKSMNYSFDIKFRAINMYLEEDTGSTTIAKKLNLNSKNRIILWVKRYKELGEDSLKERRGCIKGVNQGRPLKRELHLKRSIFRIFYNNIFFTISNTIINSVAE